MEKIKMDFMGSHHSYEILIDNGILDELTSRIKAVYSHDKVYIITDKNVASYYLEYIKNLLKDDFIVNEVIVDGGEEAKSLQVYQDVCLQLLNMNIRRNELLIALGGGVVGDLTGFIAATLYRGLPYVSIPTTLLAQMDSSIGGKTGVNLGNMKNVLGAFKQPSLVLIDPLVLKTLPRRHYNNGMGELIKHACIGNANIIKMLYQQDEIDTKIIYQSLMVKRRFVLNDEFDQKERMKLNFGHTFGHLLELNKKRFDLLHGEAVCIGMLMAIQFGIDLGITEQSCYQKLQYILEKYQLPTTKVNYQEYLPLITKDKKNLAGTIHFILIKDFGQSLIYDIFESDL